MSAAEKIPWQELAMTADECAELWAISPEEVPDRGAGGLIEKVPLRLLT